LLLFIDHRRFAMGGAARVLSSTSQWKMVNNQ
jgi:hypothetical protein